MTQENSQANEVRIESPGKFKIQRSERLRDMRSAVFERTPIRCEIDPCVAPTFVQMIRKVSVVLDKLVLFLV